MLCEKVKKSEKNFLFVGDTAIGRHWKFLFGGAFPVEYNFFSLGFLDGDGDGGGVVAGATKVSGGW